MPVQDIPQNPKYEGTLQPTLDEQIKFKIQPYLADDELLVDVNLAIELGRPLLLRGEPGCGKSRLAQAVAFEFGRRYEVDRGKDKFPWPFEFWPVKSTSRARDGLYIFDAISRLRDAQLAAARHVAGDQEAVKAARRRFEDPEHYINLGQLGLAFQNELRTVVLIDEIDKADIDFPNDLLIELDERRFFIDELAKDGNDNRPENAEEEEVVVPVDGQRIKRIKHVNGWFTAQSRPIVFITSNAEKELPDAFLRRCVFHYIEFPETKQLQRIICAHFYPEVSCPDGLEESCPEGLSQESCEQIKLAVQRFEWLRGELKNSGAPKLTSTSELLDWYRVLISWHEGPTDALALLKADERLPYISVLVKSRDAQRRYGRPKEQNNG